MFLSNKSSLFRYTLIAGLALSFVSCKDEEDPEPRIGAVTGSVSPRSASAVRLVDANNAEKTMSPTANGMFTFGNVGAGDYTIKVTPLPGWRNPGAFPVAVTGNTNTPVGEIEMVRNSYASYKVNSTVVQDSAETAFGNVMMGGGIVNDTTLMFTTNAVRAGGKSNTVEFTINNFTGKGTYSFSNISGNKAVYTTGGVNDWTSTNGSVIITDYDATHKIISGTFSFKGQQGANPLAIREVTEGKFRNIYIGENQ